MPIWHRHTKDDVEPTHHRRLHIIVIIIVIIINTMIIAAVVVIIFRNFKCVTETSFLVRMHEIRFFLPFSRSDSSGDRSLRRFPEGAKERVRYLRVGLLRGRWGCWCGPPGVDTLHLRRLQVKRFPGGLRIGPNDLSFTRSLPAADDR